MSKVKPLIEVRKYIAGCCWGSIRNRRRGSIQGYAAYRRSGNARRAAEAFLLDICTRLGVRNTAALRERIRQAVVIEATDGERVLQRD